MDFQPEQHQYYRDLYAAQKSVNVYFITCEGAEGKTLFAYVAANTLLHDELMAALEKSIIPDFAVVVEKGFGMPSAEIKEKMKAYYGFDHAVAESNRTAFKLKTGAI